MPLWRIFSHPSTFNPEQRLALAKSVTALYKGLPAFYVNVIVSCPPWSPHLRKSGIQIRLMSDSSSM